MDDTNPTETTSDSATVESEQDVRLGTWLAILAAMGYTASILALRKLAENHDADWAVWISCIKAVPSTLLAAAIVGFRTLQGERVLPAARTCAILFASGLFMQFAGNVGFQCSLFLGGMALSVALSSTTMILSSAVLGWMVLRERVSARSVVAIAVLIASIAVLSGGARDASLSSGRDFSWLIITATVLTASSAGLGWGLSGVAIRWAVTNGTTIMATVLILSLSGVVGLGLTCLIRMGPEALLATPSSDLQLMLVAGVFNAIAFILVGKAFSLISVVRVNLIQASQIAMAAVFGVLFFLEPLTVWLVVGCIMTILGVVLITIRTDS